MESKKQAGAGAQRTDRREPAKFTLYDTLNLVKKYENGWSKWQGKDSLYIFKHLAESDNKNLPVAQVYKNRHYMSGVFRTKKPLEFSGDIKDSKTGKRVFVFFNFENHNTLKIFRRV